MAAPPNQDMESCRVAVLSEMLTSWGTVRTETAKKDAMMTLDTFPSGLSLLHQIKLLLTLNAFNISDGLIIVVQFLPILA